MDLGVFSTVLALGALATDTVTGIIASNNAADEAAESAKLRAKELNLERQEQERERKNLLKQTLASQRVKFASAGINPDEGSASALLTSATEQADDDIDALRNRYNYSLEGLSNSISSAQRKNLLTNTNTLVSGASQLASAASKL